MLHRQLIKLLATHPRIRHNKMVHFFDVRSEFVFDLHHPNKAFLSKTRPPLIERNPVIFWKSVSFILMVIILPLLGFRVV